MMEAAGNWSRATRRGRKAVANLPVPMPSVEKLAARWAAARCWFLVYFLSLEPELNWVKLK